MLDEKKSVNNTKRSGVQGLGAPSLPGNKQIGKKMKTPEIIMDERKRLTTGPFRKLQNKKKRGGGGKKNWKRGTYSAKLWYGIGVCSV